MQKAKKYIGYCLAVIGGLIAAFTLFCLIFNVLECVNQEDGGGFGIDDEKSYFVDYEIEGNQIQFRYAICYVNTTKHPIAVSNHVSADFDKNNKEVKDWLVLEDTYSGFCEESEENLCVPSGEERIVIYTFTATYLGGEVNTQLSVPTLVYLTEICETENHAH